MWAADQAACWRSRRGNQSGGAVGDTNVQTTATTTLPATAAAKGVMIVACCLPAQPPCWAPPSDAPRHGHVLVLYLSYQHVCASPLTVPSRRRVRLPLRGLLKLKQLERPVSGREAGTGPHSRSVSEPPKGGCTSTGRRVRDKQRAAARHADGVCQSRLGAEPRSWRCRVCQPSCSCCRRNGVHFGSRPVRGHDGG